MNGKCVDDWITQALFLLIINVKDLYPATRYICRKLCVLPWHCWAGEDDDNCQSWCSVCCLLSDSWYWGRYWVVFAFVFFTVFVIPRWCLLSLVNVWGCDCTCFQMTRDVSGYEVILAQPVIQFEYLLQQTVSHLFRISITFLSTGFRSPRGEKISFLPLEAHLILGSLSEIQSVFPFNCIFFLLR